MKITDRERQTREIGERVGTMIFHFYQISDPVRKLEIFMELISFIVSSLVEENKGVYTVK